ncbi:hypothetical protein [Planococcus koreensis]|uniref:hypothetical protein n=1 Tax=Planococcus koreensis TaxID=112331 RepID=UPI0039FCCC38
MDWQVIREEYESSYITLKALAEKYDVKDATLRSRKNREKWQRNNATQRATKTNNVATDKKGNKQAAQRKRSGNPNPKNQFSHRNNPKFLHGLRSKFLNEEQVEIMEALEGSSFADQLWMQIEIKFSAIIRMQKIMWVEDDEDHLKVESGSGSSEFGDSVTYKVAFAFERFESYIKAQTRAMAEYRNMVKQYLELTDEFDERRMKIESMQLGIDKTRAEIDKLTSQDDDDAQKDVAAALRGLVNELNTKAD